MNLPTIDSVTESYLHYPKIIQRAVLLVDTHPTFNGITKGARSVLKVLMSRTEKTDGCAPVEATLSLVAKKAKVDRKTVTRALKTFREIGWLKEMSRGRFPGGAFCGSVLHFSPDLCRLVGLPTPGNATHGTKMSRDLYIDLTFKEDQREIQKEKRQANPTPVELPPELAEASVELGIKDTGIAKLRGLAYAAGHQLQDIIACARERVLAAQMNGGRVFRYLEAMIGKNSDYAGRAAKITRHATIIAEATQHADLAAKYRGKRFKGAAGLEIRMIGDSAADGWRDGTWFENIVGRGLQRVYADIAAGKLVEIVS